MYTIIRDAHLYRYLLLIVLVISCVCVVRQALNAKQLSEVHHISVKSNDGKAIKTLLNEQTRYYSINNLY